MNKMNHTLHLGKQEFNLIYRCKSCGQLINDSPLVVSHECSQSNPIATTLKSSTPSLLKEGNDKLSNPSNLSISNLNSDGRDTLIHRKNHKWKVIRLANNFVRYFKCKDCGEIKSRMIDHVPECLKLRGKK